MKNIEELFKRYQVKVEKEQRYKNLYEDRDAYEMKKWRKELKNYNMKNKTDVKFCYEKSENHRYAVNRGIHTMEFQKEFWDEKNKIYEKCNTPILLYGGNESLLGIARKIKWEEGSEIKKIDFRYGKIKEEILGRKKNLYDLPEKIKIDGMEYELKDIEMLIAKNHLEIYQII